MDVMVGAPANFSGPEVISASDTMCSNGGAERRLLLNDTMKSPY